MKYPIDKERALSESHQRQRELRERRANPTVVDWDAAIERLRTHMAELYDE